MYSLILREREEGGGGEKHQCVASPMRPNQGRNRNLSVCPQQESNSQPFGVLEGTPTY